MNSSLKEEKGSSALHMGQKIICILCLERKLPKSRKGGVVLCLAEKKMVFCVPW